MSAQRITAKSLLVAVAVIASTSFPNQANGQGLTVTGYIDFEAFVNGVGSNNKEFFFDNHHANLILIGEVSGNVFAATEIEYEHAGEDVALEYAYFGYTGFENVRIMAGKFIVPFGRFNKDLHPTPINKIPARPHGFSQILPQTYNDVGIWVSGGFPISDEERFVVDGFVVNGLMGEDGGAIRSMRDNDRENIDGGGRDDNKAVGARLGLELPFKGLDFGASVYRGAYAQVAADNLNLTLFGADAAYRNSGFELRGEIVRANQDATGGDLTKTGGYVQAAYLLNTWFEPVVRYSARSMPTAGADLGRFAFGSTFYISSASNVHVAYLFNQEEDGFDIDNDTVALGFNLFF